MYDFQRVDSRQDAAREKAAYDKLLAKYDALNFAADEGIFKITVHSESGAIDIPVSFCDGRGIAISLLEVHSAWVKQVEAYLNFSLMSMGEEAEAAINEAARKQYEREDKQQVAPALAQQAADSATLAQPAKRPVGRPKKAVAAALGQAAAAVPMNRAGQQPGSVVAQPKA